MLCITGESIDKILGTLVYATDNDELRVYSDSDQMQNFPIIIWWEGRLHPHFSDDLSIIQCKEATCYSTSSRKRLDDPRTQGILFYGSDLDANDLPLPRNANHEWGLFHEESPLNNYMLCHSSFIRLFNHTATFRYESDYPLTSQNIYSLDYLRERKPIDLKQKNELKRVQGLAPVLYVQSHCAVPSDRDRYIKELMKHIKVDSYGQCLHNKDLPENLRNPAESFEKEEFLDFISSYKFHIAFENAYCKDYMTEKMVRPLHVGSVPIYKGSPYAQDWMPSNHSIILADDFKSPEKLAQFINYLDNNDEEYNKYLSFKKEGGITNQFLLDHMRDREWMVNVPGKVDYFKGFECHMCRKLYERQQVELEHNLNPSVPLMPPKMANSSHMGCQQPYPLLVDPEDIPKSDV